MARPKRLKFTGTLDANRRPDRWFNGVPARDLEEGDLATLDDATIKEITGGADPLYVDPDKGSEKKADEKPAERKAG